MPPGRDPGQALLAQIEAIRAVQVAGGAGGFGHGVEPRWPARQFLGHVVFVVVIFFKGGPRVGRVRGGMP